MELNEILKIAEENNNVEKRAFLFPGQGAQYVGMGKDIYNEYGEAKNIYDKAERISEMPIKKICFEGPEEDLNKTENTQMAIFVTSLAMLEVLKSKGIQAKIAVGLSLGEYTALVYSGILGFEDGIKLVFAELKRSKIKNIIWKFWEVDSYSFTTIKKLVNVVEINEVKNTRINIGNYDSYDDYWKSLGKHAKQNVRTAYNRLKRENKKIEFKFYDSNTICENNFCTKLDEFLDLYLVRQSLKYKGGKKLHQLYLSKFNYITNSLRNDHSIMMEIRINDELAAFMQGTLNSDWSEYEIPRLAINDKFAFFSPGMILVNEAIKYMMGNTDIKIFNLCRGDEKYKYDMGGENYYTANVKLTLN